MGVNGKRNSIVEKGKELFWKFGLKKVTVEEICREAGVSKMTFYKYFTNKTDLAIYVLESQANVGFEQMSVLLSGEMTFLEKLNFLMQGKLTYTENMSNEFFKDIWSDQNSALYTLLVDLQKKSNELFIDFLRKGQEEGDVRSDLNIDFVVDYTTSIVKMYEDENFIDKYGSVQDLTREAINFLFFGISKR